MKTLIIGMDPGNIGEAVNIALYREVEVRQTLFTPHIGDLDVEDEASIRRYLLQHGPFDQIVYSAGINRLTWIKDLSERALTVHAGVNYQGLALLMGAHEILFPTASGRLVAIVSDASDTPMRGSLAYCASKAAEAMTVRVLARELAPRWVTVAVSPGVVEDTPMTTDIDQQVQDLRGWTAEEARAYEDKGSILGRRVTKAEIAETVLFALRGPAALNGSTITLNGGK